MIKKGWIFFAAFSFMLGAASLLPAAVITVPGDHPTIQGALNAATSGDEIQVAPGTYYENLVWTSGSVTLRSTGGRDVTIIDGSSGSGNVINISANLSENPAVEGFTITNSGPDDAVIGITGGFMAMPSVTIRDCVISNGGQAGINFMVPLGAGTLTVDNCDVQGNGDFGIEAMGMASIAYLTGCTISNNVEGGIMAFDLFMARIKDNEISNNQAAGIFTGYYMNPMGIYFIDNNAIQNNGGVGLGIGIMIFGSSANTFSITGNTISGNNGQPDPLDPAASTDSGGIMGMIGTSWPATISGSNSALQISGVEISRNTISDHVGDTGCGINIAGGTIILDSNRIYGNSGDDPAGFSGGVVLSSTPDIAPVSALATNNVIYNNSTHGVYTSASVGAMIVLTNNTIVGNQTAGVEDDGDVNSTITNCILWSNNDDLVNATAIYSDIEDGDPGEGNISAGPLFVAADDFHIQATSPCIDVGKNDALGISTKDMDNQTRSQDGNNDGTAVVDMGADEVPAAAQPWGAASTVKASATESAHSSYLTQLIAYAGVFLAPLAMILAMGRARDRFFSR